VEEGLFVEITELLPSYLNSADLDADGKHSESCKHLPVLEDIDTLDTEPIDMDSKISTSFSTQETYLLLALLPN